MSRKQHYDYDAEREKFTFQPGRTLAFSIIFAALVMWQSGFSLWYALPVWLGIWALFTLGHWFYIWINRALVNLGQRSHEKLDEKQR